MCTTADGPDLPQTLGAIEAPAKQRQISQDQKKPGEAFSSRETLAMWLTRLVQVKLAD